MPLRLTADDLYDAAIIGAGPAGSGAAIALARAGKRVAVVEKASFPRVKVCGEFISPAATPSLERLLTPAQLRGADAQRVHELIIEFGDRMTTWAMPEPAWVLSRATLDTVLLDEARSVGAEVRQPAIVREVDCEADHASITLDDGAVIRSAVVLHADGKGRFDPARDTPNRPGVVGRKVQLRVPPGGPDLSGIRMRACDGAYVGSVGVECGLVTVALVARSSLVSQFKGPADSAADAMLVHLWPDYDPAWRETPWLSCGVAGSRYIRPGHERSFRLGNAAAAVEPVGGEGIGLALWSGTTLADLLVSARSLGAVQTEFARMYRQRLRWRRPACRAASWVLEKPRVMGALWPLLSREDHAEAVIGPWYALTGKA
jgi:2-polyprenyl-6-methoxyphenol hydroxylase-like FAD-dependent oxidoreductase